MQHKRAFKVNLEFVVSDEQPYNVATLKKKVSDHRTPEHEWVEACEQLGDKPIVKEPSALTTWFTAFMSMVAATCAVWCVPIAFACVYAITVDLLKVFGGVDANWDWEYGLGFASAFRLSFIAAIAFWATMLQGKVAQRLSCVAMFMLLFITQVGASTMPHLLTNLALFGMFCMLARKVCDIGKWCRESLPKYLTWQRIAAVSSPVFALPILSIPGLIIVVIFAGIAQALFHLPVSTAMVACLVPLFICVFIPGMLMGYLSKSKSREACALLAVVMQTPLIVGLLWGSFIASFAAIMLCIPGGTEILHRLWPANIFDDVQTKLAAAKAALLFVMTLFVSAMAAAGGYYGAGLSSKQTKSKHVVF